MKVHKLTVMVIDFDNLGLESVISTLEDQRYPNHCMSPKVMEASSADIGIWNDDNPLNRRDTEVAEFERLFSDQ